jgi:hypothetical protein
MPAPTFVLFTPVPLRARADGWSPALQLHFLEGLARGMTPGAAARALGKNRQTAYALRKRPGAESFAAAWDAAVAFARANRAAERTPDCPPPFVPPSRAEAEQIARRGRDAVFAAPDRDTARAAFTQMLRSIWGPKDDNSAAENKVSGDPNFPNLPAKSVAFRGARLRRPPC